MIKIERSYPAPKSLEIESKKANGRYDGIDVVRQLRNDFHNKCYICGIAPLQDPQIEHRLPHKNGKYPDRKFDWDNLFLSCGHCNSIKNQDIYDDYVLDCCKRDPENCIDFILNGRNVFVIAKNENDNEAVITANLMMEVFNKKNTGMREYKSQMRLNALLKEMNVFFDILERYSNGDHSIIVKRTLRGFLDKKSMFAEFKRCYIRLHKEAFSELLAFII